MRSFWFAALLIVSACQKAEKQTSSGSGSGTTVGTGSAAVAPKAGDALDSKDILDRTKTSPDVFVKHVLYGWKELEPAYRGQMDPRAKNRTKQEAETLAKKALADLKAKPADLDAIVKERSEDPGMASGDPYNVKSDTPFVPEFKNLALRLEVNEAGIVKTNYGYHVIMRIAPPPPPPPDPLESADILARVESADAKAGVHVQHVLVAWKGMPAARSPEAQARSKEDADKLVKEIVEKIKAKGDMAALMKQYSEDPGSKDNGRVYDVKPGSGMVEPFEKLSLRLNLNEAGIVKTQFGWHVIKRVPPPPPPKPDSLDSVDILKREIKSPKTKVKHVLLGWAEVNAGDERGKKRTRKELEKLVKDTVAKLKKGDAIEPIMKELSEDPGSAASGEGYDVTPDAGLVPPFKNLGLRLDVNEVGVVKTDFGIHIIKRVE